MTTNTALETRRQKLKLIVWTALLVSIAAGLATGCAGPAVAPDTPTAEVREPFSSRRESEDGTIVSWSGYTKGYEPGGEAEFDITVQNETDGTWLGCFCVQLLEGDAPTVIANLEQREFTLEPGMGFTDEVMVRLPEDLDDGAYGLSLVVCRPGGPMVDLIPIQIGDTEDARRTATQDDMEASLDSCPPVQKVQTVAEDLVDMAVADLADRLGINSDGIEVRSVEARDFPDTSLGVPEPGMMYAQVITPGYIIELIVNGKVYEYHGSGERVVAVPDVEGEEPTGRIIIEGVQVTDERITVYGQSTLAGGTCLGSELWAGGEMVAWWPGEQCVPVTNGKWEMVVRLGSGEVPTELDATDKYMLRVYEQGGPNIVAVFAIDLSSPPAPPTSTPAGDPTLLLPDSASTLSQASADLNGDGAAELVFLAGFGGTPNGPGYDFLQMFLITRAEGGGYAVAWQSEQLPTDRAEPLRLQDINGNDLHEVLSVQAMGATGETLYVLGWNYPGYGWLSPQGGYFEGEDSFGEVGVRLEDADGDGLMEIVASYGPAAESSDVYGWDGRAYVYQRTIGGAETPYQSVQVAEVGVSLEVPATWTEIDAGTWSPSQGGVLRVGVRWAELRPPQEPEAALLPQPAQIIDSEPVTLTWGSGRSLTVEVYGEAKEGESRAPVVAVETHVLVVVEREGARWAFDVYIGAPDADQLEDLEAVLEHALGSVKLE